MTETATRPTMDDLLSKRGPSKLANAKTHVDAIRIATGQEGVPAVEAKAETVTEAAPTEAKAESKPEQKSTETVKAETKAPDMVPRSEITKLRQKLREANEKIRDLEAKTKEEPGYYDTGAQVVAAESETADNNTVYKKYLDDKFVSSWLRIKDQLGENEADALYAEFDDICKYQEETAPNETRIWDVMYSQPDPGRFMLDYVKNYKEQKKYGDSPQEWKKSIRDEIEKEIADNIKADLMKKYNIRDQLPRDIAGSRASSGGSVSTDRPSLNNLLDKRRHGLSRK